MAEDHVEAIGGFIVPSMTAELYLYGSRLHDELKGGDIDLILVCDSTENTEKLNNSKIDILRAIKDRIGERRIDLLIAEEHAEDAFVKKALSSAVSLGSWRR